ncbi:hypothetical protein GGX14DRAFT_370642 [Mycena pura]|uniref:Uncharacterized protein n=1 Tax=Mycena pura TaxID=153505 RepID=A0AAD6Y8G9_9AGAR|nr:hypothetical protein GGX14DRAFT_370642 [Mycena pura]
MILKCGLGRASFMWGSSTHNTRIERLWVEVGSQFARSWQWNCHPISGEGHDQSPNDLCLIGQVQYGVYANSDDYENVHPDLLEQYYGIHGQERRSNQTGAGQLDDEDIEVPDADTEEEDDSSDDDDLIAQIDAALEDKFNNKFNNKPMTVPRHANPFTEDEQNEKLFDATLAAMHAAGMVPDGYGLHPDEWDDGIYPSYEILKSGRRGGKKLRVALPDSIWRPRAEMWGQGLSILKQMQYLAES